jgi:hypothetical protein
LNHHVFNKRGFARASLAYDVNVMASVFGFYAERAPLFPESSFAERLYFVQMMFVQRIKIVSRTFYKDKRAIARPFAVCPNIFTPCPFRPQSIGERLFEVRDRLYIPQAVPPATSFVQEKRG